MTASHAARPVVARLWRDHDGRVNALPGMALGTHSVWPERGGGAADRFYDLGARLVDLPELVDITGAAPSATTVWTLALIRDLTRLGVKVGWRLRLDQQTDWRMLNHLWPPQEILGRTEEVASNWRQSHYLGKCTYRHGPGFVQVRDRRDEQLVKFTIDENCYLAAITPLLHGVPARDVPGPVFADYLAENLLLRVGELALWLPYQVLRWPVPSFVV
jgi:hypothetical protein